MYLRAGKEPMYLTRRTRVITKSEYLSVWNPEVYRQPSIWSPAVSKADFGNKGIARNVKETYTNLIAVTQAHTPFIYPEYSPAFRLVFNHKTSSPQSWVDVIISAKLAQKPLKYINCITYYPLLETLSVNRTGSNKLAAKAGRKFSILANLKERDQDETVKFGMKVSTRLALSKTKVRTHIYLHWASHIELSRDFSRKIIALP